MEKVTEYIGLGVEQGGKILIGGNRLEGEIKEFDDASGDDGNDKEEE